MRHVLAIDQGTTGTTVLVIDETLSVKGRGYQEYRQIYPQPGWVEHDPNDIWNSVLSALATALSVSAIEPSSIAAIGITNHRETSVLWDRRTGAPVHNAIVWQDRRTSDTCAALKAAGHEARVRQCTGLTLDPYFSATKVRWMLDHAGLRSRAVAGDLAFGTVDSFLIWQLSAGHGHVTDVTNASRTLLLDLHTRTWSDEMLALFDVPRCILPTVIPSSGVCETTRGYSSSPQKSNLKGHSQLPR